MSVSVDFYSPGPIRQRLRQKSPVDPNGCWVWGGKVTPAGYGQIRVAQGAGPVAAHRVSYELHVGPIPEGLVIDHLCRVRRCVNPAHLEAVTQAENVARGEAAWALTGMCRAGLHDITDPANVVTESSGARTCRPCRTERFRRHSQKRKDQR